MLQGLYSLGHLYDTDTKRRNFDFYEPITVHESSLSPCIHSILAAEIGYREKAVEMYRRTARLDLDNINHDTEDGLHITSMPGSWLAIAQGFAACVSSAGWRSPLPAGRLAGVQLPARLSRTADSPCGSAGQGDRAAGARQRAAHDLLRGCDYAQRRGGARD